MVHEGYGAPPRLLFGAAMPIARAHQHTASGAAGQRVGKTPPQRDGAETLVQHDDGGDGRIARCKPEGLQPFAIDHYVGQTRFSLCNHCGCPADCTVSTQGTLHCAPISSGNVPELASCVRPPPTRRAPNSVSSASNRSPPSQNVSL